MRKNVKNRCSKEKNDKNRELKEKMTKREVTGKSDKNIGGNRKKNDENKKNRKQ